MDIDLFPNSVEYWGPNGMVFFRNVQLRWMPIKGDTRLTVALERPGASADQGDFSDRIELQNITTNFPLPDLSAEYRQATGFGYVEIAGIVRYMEWTDQLDDGDDLSGDAVTAIKDGKLAFAIDQQQYAQGYLSVVLLYLNKINGHELGGGQPMYTGPGFVTKDNADLVQKLAEAGTR